MLVLIELDTENGCISLHVNAISMNLIFKKKKRGETTASDLRALQPFLYYLNV